MKKNEKSIQDESGQQLNSAAVYRTNEDEVVRKDIFTTSGQYVRSSETENMSNKVKSHEVSTFVVDKDYTNKKDPIVDEARNVTKGSPRARSQEINDISTGAVVQQINNIQTQNNFQIQNRNQIQKCDQIQAGYNDTMEYVHIGSESMRSEIPAHEPSYDYYSNEEILNGAAYYHESPEQLIHENSFNSHQGYVRPSESEHMQEKVSINAAASLTIDTNSNFISKEDKTVNADKDKSKLSPAKDRAKLSPASNIDDSKVQSVEDSYKAADENKSKYADANGNIENSNTNSAVQKELEVTDQTILQNGAAAHRTASAGIILTDKSNIGRKFVKRSGVFVNTLDSSMEAMKRQLNGGGIDIEETTAKRTLYRMADSPIAVRRVANSSRTFITAAVQTVISGKRIIKHDGSIRSILSDGKSKIFHGKSGSGVTGMLRDDIYDFEGYGSDDLGIETVTKVKDTVFESKKGIQAVQNTIRNVQQAARFAKRFVKGSIKIIANPVTLKGMAIAAIALLLFGGISGMAGAAASLFSGFTYAADDNSLTDAYAYVTELDADLQMKIEHMEEQPEWSYIDVFNYYTFVPRTDPVPIISYLSVKYEEFTFEQVKNEIYAIHEEMYNLVTTPWENEIVTDPVYDNAGNMVSEGTVEIEYNLDIELNYKTFNAYIMVHEDTMFPKKDDKQRYETFNEIGGTQLRNELGKPFKGQQVYVSSRFGWRVVNKNKEQHEGIDIALPEGTQINACFSGKVEVGRNDRYGNYVKISSKSGKKSTLYAHCSSVSVSSGQEVKKGDIIAAVGSSGSTTGSHLHLEFEKKGKKLNPLYYIESSQFVLGADGNYVGNGVGDGEYSGLIAFAEQYLGMPYVWGGKNPETSFDCSGFISWVYTQTGVHPISSDAQGIYNSCTNISEGELKPGDLVFFQGTYSTPKTVTHVGIYVGNGTMLHCGDPIQYTSFNTPYWKSHFYAYGRLN